MQTKTYFLATIATLLSVTHSAPAPDPKCKLNCAVAIGAGVVAGGLIADSGNNNNNNNNNNQPKNTNGGTIECSADTSTADVVPFAQDPAWASSMKGCLNQLDNAEWNGYDCIPNSGNDTVIGVPFGFYKGNKNVASGQTCFDKCYPCLAKGIDGLRAVTTSCRWEGDGEQECWVGFNYGG